MAKARAYPSAALTSDTPIVLPGDKSVSHRALLFGTLAIGETRIEGLLESEDVLGTAKACAALGAGVERLGPGAWRVAGVGVGGLAEPRAPLDFGNSGTGVRLAMGMVAGSPITAIFTGDQSLSRRPMGRVLDPLRRMGVSAQAREGDRLPVTLRGASPLLPMSYRLPVASAQVKSAVLLAGLGAPGITEVIEPEPTRDHTERMLSAFGADLEIEDRRGERHIRLTGEPELFAVPVAVPGDPSSAAFPLVAALLVEGSRLVLKDILVNPLRTGLLRVLSEMGASIRIENEREAAGDFMADIHVEASPLKAIETPPEIAPSMIDEYPILAVAAAFAEGRSVLRGLAELRVKESDRLAATARGLEAIGVRVEEGEDWLAVEGMGPGGVPGQSVSAAAVETHLDHRIAMAFLVAGLASKQGCTVDDTSMIATSFPDFLPIMKKLGARIDAEEAREIA